jgi:glycosyltransferase involved in cell wall biosynthesis
MNRILHVITGLGPGGAETMLLKLLSGGSRDFNPIVVSLDRDERALEPAIRQLRIPVHCLGLHRLFPNPMAAVALRRIVRHFRPHLIQGWMPHGNLVASFAGLSSRDHAPVLWNIRMSLSDSREEPRLTRTVIRLGAFLSWYPKAIIYNNRSGAQQHEALGYRASKRVFIPNGFDCQVFHPDQAAGCRLRSELGLGEGQVLVGLVARYHPMKDHAGFLRAATLVLRSHPDTRFVLVGKQVHESQPDLRKTIRDQQLHNHVFLLGERRDIPQITAALDIACSASFWGEGFSNAIGEALACGIPCVVTDIGDSASIVADAGLVVPPRSPEAFALAIAQLIKAGPERRRELGDLGRRRVQGEFSLPVVVRRYEDLYHEHLYVGPSSE